MAENLADVKPYPVEQDIIRSLDNAIKEDSHLVVLHGNLASEGAVAKITGKEGLGFTGTARVFDSEEESMASIIDGSIKEGDVLVIRYEGPKGGPGMREMLAPTSAIMGRGLGDKVAFITDGRFSGGTHGFVVGHITPEAYQGGAIAVVEDGDTITIDSVKNELRLHLDDDVIQQRLSLWKKPEPRYKRGVLAKYAQLVSSASEGAVTDKHLS